MTTTTMTAESERWPAGGHVWVGEAVGGWECCGEVVILVEEAEDESGEEEVNDG